MIARNRKNLTEFMSETSERGIIAKNVLILAQKSLNLKQYDTALKYLQYALELNDSRDEYAICVAFSYIMMARGFQDQKLIDKAIQSFELAIPRLGAEFLGLVIHEYHELLTLSKRPAIKIYLEAINAYKEKNYYLAFEKLQYVLNKFSGVKQATCYSAMASCLHKMDEKESAINCCKNALKILGKIKSPESTSETEAINTKLKNITQKNSYLFYTKNHYKIWFSKHPHIFLDIENQLRFIREVRRNPGVTYTFIYSSTCLDELALANLKDFCTKYNIVPLDFDTEVTGLLIHENDKKLYQLAKQEIDLTIKNEGGNLAGASDIIRVMAPVIAKCGIYEDFEHETNFSSCPELIECDVAFMLNVYDFDKEQECYEYSNDIFAMSVNKNDPTQISDDALEKLLCVQEKLISYYQQPDSILYGWHKNIDAVLKLECPVSWHITAEYFKRNPDATIFSWRKTVAELDFAGMVNLFDDALNESYIGDRETGNSLSLEEIKTRMAQAIIDNDPAHAQSFNFKDHIDLADQLFLVVQHRLLKCSVMLISGSKSLNPLFEIPEHFNQDSFIKFSRKLREYGHQIKMRDMYLPHRPFQPTDHPLDNIGCFPDFDCSWLILGEKKKEERIADMVNAASFIQKTWRRKKGTLDVFFKPADEKTSCANDDVSSLKMRG